MSHGLLATIQTMETHAARMGVSMATLSLLLPLIFEKSTARQDITVQMRDAVLMAKQ